MTPTQLKEFLAEKFEVVSLVDLAELSAVPGTALKFFRQVYRLEYHETCKIVIYTNDHNISNELLEHIYQTANFVDVSNWFVLFVTTVDITKKLEKACADVSTDSVPFQNLVLPISCGLPLSSKFSLPATICAVPWSNLEIKSDGLISPCCMSTMTVGNITDISLEDAFSGQQMQAFRQEFLEGKRPSACNGCWNAESQGLTSIRQHNTKRLKEAFLTDYIDHPKISTVDLKFQNTCNFKCRICSPGSSSLFADESRKHRSIKIAPSSKWSDSDRFIDQFNKHLPHLTNIDMYGGEPFLIKKFASVLKTAVETGVAKNIRLHYNSNGSVWPDEFLPYWPHFKQVDIHFSIDAVGDRFATERGSTWDLVESNILRIKNLNLENLTISIMPSVGAMNILYIDEVLEWAATHNFQIFVSHVRHKELALKNLTAEAKALIVNKYKHSAWPEMKNILQALENLPDSDGSEFRKLTDYFDSIRNEDFSKTHPELAQVMGYVPSTHLNYQKEQK